MLQTLFNKIKSARHRYVHGLFSVFGKLRRTEHVFMVLSAIVIGILAAFGAIGFRYLIKFFHILFFNGDIYAINYVAHLVWWKKLLLPVTGGLIVGPIVQFIAIEIRGSGIPEVMESVAVHGGSIRPRVVVFKALAAAVTIGSGGSAGREGPIVQIGSAIGSAFGQFLTVSAGKLRTLVACGAAAGIAATFNAPIAGSLFAIEIILGDFAVAQFSPIVISSVTATVISRHYIGDFPAFRVPEYSLVSALEFIPYTILGVLAGAIAVFFIYFLYKTQGVFDRFKVPAFLKPAAGGLVVGIIALRFPQVYGVGYESINDALWGLDVRWLLFALILLKIAATSATLGSGGSGGIFAPSLFIGAMLGSLIGKEIHLLYPQITADAGAYALVGMGAMVSATTHAPITSILIIFELSGDYHIIPPLMVSCIISVLLATYLKKESIYTMKLVNRGINIFEGKDINVLRRLFVRDIIRRDCEIIPVNLSFKGILERILRSSHHEYFVINQKQELAGMLSFAEFKNFLKDEAYLSDLVIAADIIQPSPTLLYPDDNLDLVMHQFGLYNVDELPVIESKNVNRLIGSVQRKDVIDAYNQQIFKYDLAGGVHSIVTAVNKDREIELTDGYRLVEIFPPDGFIGKSIKDINIRFRFGVEVIMIRRTEKDNKKVSGRSGIIPTPDYVIQHNDKLLVLGDRSHLQLLQK